MELNELFKYEKGNVDELNGRMIGDKIAYSIMPFKESHLKAYEQGLRTFNKEA